MALLPYKFMIAIYVPKCQWTWKFQRDQLSSSLHEFGFVALLVSVHENCYIFDSKALLQQEP